MVKNHRYHQTIEVTEEKKRKSEEKKRKSEELIEESPKKKNNSSVEEPVANGDDKKRKKKPRVRKRKKLSFGGTLGDWTCSSCSFENFAERSKCKQCKQANASAAGATTGEGTNSKWECSGCGFPNFAFRLKCKQCSVSNAANEGIVAEHRVGMSNMACEVTEEDIKQLFSPLELERVNLITRWSDEKPQGKANAFFKTHQDALTAMQKDKSAMGSMIVNLYLDSTDTPAEAILEDKNEADESTSEQPTHTFKWKKMIKSCLAAEPNKTLSVKKLRKALLLKYTEVTGEACSKEELKEKLEHVLNKVNSKFTYENGTVSL